MEEVLLHKKTLEFIPLIYHQEGLVEICRVTDKILEQYFNELNRADLQRDPTTATYSLQHWADMTGCNINNLTTDEAQKEVLMSMKAQTQVTRMTIKKLIETNANADCDVVEIFDKYYITVTFTSKIGIPPNIEQIKKKLREVLPAHLNYEMIFKYRTWGDLKKLGKTWGYYKDNSTKWEDLKSKSEL